MSFSMWNIKNACLPTNYLQKSSNLLWSSRAGPWLLIPAGFNIVMFVIAYGDILCDNSDGLKSDKVVYGVEFWWVLTAKIPFNKYSYLSATKVSSSIPKSIAFSWLDISEMSNRIFSKINYLEWSTRSYIACKYLKNIKKFVGENIILRFGYSSVLLI